LTQKKAFYLSSKHLSSLLCYFCGPKVTKSLFGPQCLLALNLFQPLVSLVAPARSFCGRLGEALAGLAERLARLSFSGQAMMEIEKLLHAAISNGLSGPILFPRPSPKHCLTPFSHFLIVICGL
jgi:hypothetical protein